MLYKNNNWKILSSILAITGTISILIGVSQILFNYAKVDMYQNYLVSNDIKVITYSPQNLSRGNDNMIESYTRIPTYNQAVEGYILGCEGISLYMALKGLGYIKNFSVKEFMDTMPIGKTPFEGYVGNPKIGHDGENKGKRTTIYPAPLASWARQFASSKDLTGASIDDLKKELSAGHVLLVFVTSGWKTPKWKQYSWSRTTQGEVENNHCLCIVGYRKNGDFLVNDCHDGRVDGRYGEYWVSGAKFAEIYNIRKYAVSVY